MYERFTDRARQVLDLGNQEAVRFNREFFETEHILLGLAKEGSGVACNILKNFDLDLRKIRQAVEKLVPSPSETCVDMGLPRTPHARKAIKNANEESRRLNNHYYVGTEHLLLGVLRDPEFMAVKVLVELGVTAEQVREAVLSLLGHGEEEKDEPIEQTAASKPADQSLVEMKRIIDEFCAEAGVPVELFLRLLKQPVELPQEESRDEASAAARFAHYLHWAVHHNLVAFVRGLVAAPHSAGTVYLGQPKQ